MWLSPLSLSLSSRTHTHLKDTSGPRRSNEERQMLGKASSGSLFRTVILFLTLHFLFLNFFLLPLSLFLSLSFSLDSSSHRFLRRYFNNNTKCHLTHEK